MLLKKSILVFLFLFACFTVVSYVNGADYVSQTFPPTGTLLKDITYQLRNTGGGVTFTKVIGKVKSSDGHEYRVFIGGTGADRKPAMAEINLLKLDSDVWLIRRDKGYEVLQK
jgi:hypothetical protein